LETPTLANPETVHQDSVALYSKGGRTFSLLFTRWMDTNGWSHPTMVRLARAALGDIGWLHSSQISGLRHNGLESPGPRTFIAIAQLNAYIHRYATTKRLIPGTESSKDYHVAYAITENDQPPAAGWWFEVFCGLRIPQDIDLREAFFSDAQATTISTNWGALIRKLLRDQDLDLITDLDRILRDSYPAKDFDRLARLRQVIQNQYTWTPDELSLELPALTAFTSELGGPVHESELLALLQS